MSTLGIEMCDAGFEVALGRDDEAEGPPSAEFLTPPGSVPAVALASDEGTFSFGAAAEQRRFLVPRRISDVFWDELSLQPSNLRAGRRAVSHSELAYHFLRHVFDTLPGEAAEHTSAVLALPSAFIDGGGRAEERVGILLGMCDDLDLRLGALVDGSCAALLDPAAVAPSRGTVLHVDLNLQSAVLTVLDLGVHVSRQACSRIPGAGWLAVTDAARRALADRFLRQTSFDVSAERRTEQEFYAQSLEALHAFSSQQEAWLRIVSGSRERSISVPRDALAGDLKPLTDSLAKGAKDMLGRTGHHLSGVHVVLTHRARLVCGIAKAFRAEGAIALSTLAPGAAARGAAVLAFARTPPEEISEVPLEDSLPLPDTADDIAGALRSAFAFRRHPGERTTAPTHVVFDGVCTPLRPTGMRIGTGGEGAAGDITVPLSPAAIGACDLVLEPVDGRWQAAAFLGSERHEIPGGEAPLAPGDVLEIHGLPGVARLLFVRMAG